MASLVSNDKKGHVCPPSNAIHPADRWETMFVYSFICKFTPLRTKTEGLDTATDLEDALLSQEPSSVLTAILTHFIRNLRPQTRNVSRADQISTTVAVIVGDYLKSPERTIFWNDDLGKNEDPFEKMTGGFFAASWDLKLKILRQLVELQLCHTKEIKATIDRAWGVGQHKHKKKDELTAPPPPDDPKSQEKLAVVPIGQDINRRRFWVADDTPRLYTSTNPWKISATFETVSTTKEEYLGVIDELKAMMPAEAKSRKSKLELAHSALIDALESRIDAIDAELARIQRARRKIEQRKNLEAFAELRETRTRKRTQKPDYVYGHDADSGEEGDEYDYQEDEEYSDDVVDGGDFGHALNKPNGRQNGTRRSTRSSVVNPNGKRSAANGQESWQGERRSARLGVPMETHSVAPRTKRARTEESTASSVDALSVSSATSRLDRTKYKASGAAAVKPTEVALEVVKGKKKSKFWFYAVEPIPGAPNPVDPSEGSSSGGVDLSNKLPTNGRSGESREPSPLGSEHNGMDYEVPPERSSSPTTSRGSGQMA